MIINWVDIIQVAGLITVAIAMYTFFEKQRRDRDGETKWRTEADLKLAEIHPNWTAKLDSIDVKWKPGVEARLETLEDRQLNIEKQVAQSSDTIVDKLEMINSSLHEMNTNIAVMNKSMEYFQTRVEKLESNRD